MDNGAQPSERLHRLKPLSSENCRLCIDVLPVKFGGDGYRRTLHRLSDHTPVEVCGLGGDSGDRLRVHCHEDGILSAGSSAIVQEFVGGIACTGHGVRDCVAMISPKAIFKVGEIGGPHRGDWSWCSVYRIWCDVLEKSGGDAAVGVLSCAGGRRPNPSPHRQRKLGVHRVPRIARTGRDDSLHP